MKDALLNFDGLLKARVRQAKKLCCILAQGRACSCDKKAGIVILIITTTNKRNCFKFLGLYKPGVEIK